MKLSDRFIDLTSYGLPSSDLGNMFLSNSTVYKNYPGRFNFYIQLLDSLNSSNPNASKDVIKISNLNKYKLDKENSQYDFINYYFNNVIKNKDSDNKLNNKLDNELEKIAEKINTKLQQSVAANNVKAAVETAQEGGELDSNDQNGNSEPSGFKKYAVGVTGETELANNDKYNVIDGRVKMNQEGKQILNDNTEQILQKYKNSLEYGPTVEKVRMSDRLIFVIATYILRAVASFMVEWGVHINYINSFVKAFSLYFGVYACIFLVLFILTNASEKDMVFRMLFFYINTQSAGGKGLLRVFIHLVCIMFLFPIPFIVREYREMKSKTLSFTEKRSIINAVNKFTMLTWILTSIVALRL
jgi:hypothetical protein